MTDRTQPDSGRIITSGDLLLQDAETALMYEELRAAIDDGHESMTHADLAAHCRSTTEHWGGRWSIVVEGPAPESHDSEDDFDAAIDAARSQAKEGDPQ